MNPLALKVNSQRVHIDLSRILFLILTLKRRELLSVDKSGDAVWSFKEGYLFLAAFITGVAGGGKRENGGSDKNVCFQALPLNVRSVRLLGNSCQFLPLFKML